MGRLQRGRPSLDAGPVLGYEPPRMLRAWPAVVTSLALSTGAGCLDTPIPVVPSRPVALPAWEGEQRQIFDDAIDPSAIGVSMSGASPALDPLLKVRTQTADLVGRFTVATVTQDRNGESAQIHLTLRVEPTPLLRRGIDGPFVELLVTEATEAFGLVTTYESALRGRTFIGFVKRFAGTDGPALHWHLTADAPDVAQGAALAADLDAVD